jgi:hypothetical protein
VHAQNSRQRPCRTRCSRPRRRRYRGVKCRVAGMREAILAAARQTGAETATVCLVLARRTRAMGDCETVNSRPQRRDDARPAAGVEDCVSGGTHAARHVQSSPCHGRRAQRRERLVMLSQQLSVLGVRWSLLRALPDNLLNSPPRPAHHAHHLSALLLARAGS